MTMTETFDDHELDDEPVLPPPRPRRRLTPLTGALTAVLLVAVGFLGGALVQKHVGDDGGRAGGMPSGPPGGMPAMAAGGAGAAGGRAGATIGEVANVKGGVLYVTDADGNTLKVTAAKGATVTRTGDAEPREIRPGEQVVIEGEVRDGAISATSIRAGDLSAAMGALGAGGPGGAPAAAAAGGGSTAGEQAERDAVDQSFEDGSTR